MSDEWPLSIRAIRSLATTSAHDQVEEHEYAQSIATMVPGPRAGTLRRGNFRWRGFRPCHPDAHADVGDEDRGETAGGGHCSGTPALRRPWKMGSSRAIVPTRPRQHDLANTVVLRLCFSPSP